jgi:hypothetical protein
MAYLEGSTSMISILASMVVVAAPGVLPPADSLDACGLYTREDIAAFAGESTKKPRAFTTNPAMHSSCTTETSTGKWTVKVYIERWADKEIKKLSLDALKKVGGLKPVSGLGDEAYWGQVSPTKGQYHVIIGLTMVSIQTYGKAPGAGTPEKTRPIADAVIARYKERYQ